MRPLLSLLIFLAMTSATLSRGNRDSPSIANCEKITTAFPGTGISYRGAVSNDDYGFEAVIPKGLTGWGGVADEAPYHGFVIFLNDSDPNSCIVFEIHHRVDDEPTAARPKRSKALALGTADAWQAVTSSKATIRGLTNVVTKFSNRRGPDVDDGQLVLITHGSEANSAEKVYDMIVRSLKFKN